MIFEAIWESARRGELILVDHGYCRYHVRRDGQLTIREILTTKPGVGGELLHRLRLAAQQAKATCIMAKCPADLEANQWYAKKGFVLDRSERTRSGREVNVWRLPT